MRRSALALLLVGGAAGPAAAEPTLAEPVAGAGLAVFSDAMTTTVVTPHAGCGALVAGGIELDARWSADIISSASVDVITAATTSMSETRHELGLTARRQFIGGLDLDGGYTYSTENDSDAHVLTLGVRRGVLQKNLELGARYGGSFNRLGVRDEPAAAWRHMWIHSMELTLGRVLGRRTMAELVGSGYLATGYQAGPYRRVPITAGDDLRAAPWVAENVPDLRLRAALTARVRHAFGRRWVASAEYRFYFDDWGLVAHTASAEQSVDLGAGLLLRTRERAMIQQAGAWFYQERYPDRTRYRTRDRRLGPHESGMAGAALVWVIPRAGPFAELTLHVGADALLWRFDHFLEPVLTPTGAPGLDATGWVWGSLVEVGVEAQL